MFLILSLYIVLFIFSSIIIWLFYKVIATSRLNGCLSDQVEVFFSSTSKDISWDNIKSNICNSGDIYVSVVIPAYNEEERILNTLDSIVDYMETRSKQDSNFRYEIIVVNDGSNDNTLLVCKEFWFKRFSNLNNNVNGGLLLLSCLYNNGKGNAVKLGVLSSSGNLILMTDADGATKINCFSKLENTYFDNKENCIVFGSRICDSTDQNVKIYRRWYRYILNKIFHLIILLIVSSDIKDTQCGFKLFPRKYAKTIFPSLHIKGWAFDIEIVIISRILNIDIKPISVDWSEVKGSKLSILKDSIIMLFDILTLRLLYLFRIWSVKVSH
ncbi:dolichyl phosphate glucosyltransferase [Cryptosporidium ryanae]|uniref:dolichyl phosphate glucosyltransferase n=1 Tax=Cryptosporidium ryanae TaxID=515981 RepID=UPI00351A526B|nr:dolichyl phosphate glucosyltransferase [Cryptosporidium ryanae]